MFLSSGENMTIRRLLPVLTLTLWLGVADLAKGDISYTYVTDSTSYTAATAGSTITVSIFLNENLSGSSTSLEVANQGLSTAGFYVTTTAGNASTITAIAANRNSNNSAGNPGSFGNANDGFNGPDNSGVTVSSQVATDGSKARLLEATNATNGFGPVGAQTSFGSQLLLGTVSIKAGAAGSSTTFTLETYRHAPTSIGGSGTDGNTTDNGLFVSGVSNDYDVSGTSTATGQSYTGADVSQFETFTVTVAAVPEPSSMLLCGLAACGGLYGVYRRRKAQAAKVPVA
jgi:hypothetical protein